VVYAQVHKKISLSILYTALCYYNIKSSRPQTHSQLQIKIDLRAGHGDHTYNPSTCNPVIPAPRRMQQGELKFQASLGLKHSWKYNSGHRSPEFNPQNHQKKKKKPHTKKINAYMLEGLDL
jgi:hypothetical protein